MSLIPFTIKFSKGREAKVVNKMSGRKRSERILFFRLRKSEKLIRYTVALQGPKPIEYQLYKKINTGDWIPDGERDGSKLLTEDHLVVSEIEKAIDAFEASLGGEGYKRLY